MTVTEASAAITTLIEETNAWRDQAKARGFHIEAAACSVRIKALRDALAAIALLDEGAT